MCHSLRRIACYTAQWLANHRLISFSVFMVQRQDGRCSFAYWHIDILTWPVRLPSKQLVHHLSITVSLEGISCRYPHETSQLEQNPIRQHVIWLTQSRDYQALAVNVQVTRVFFWRSGAEDAPDMVVRSGLLIDFVYVSRDLINTHGRDNLGDAETVAVQQFFEMWHVNILQGTIMSLH